MLRAAQATACFWSGKRARAIAVVAGVGGGVGVGGCLLKGVLLGTWWEGIPDVLQKREPRTILKMEYRYILHQLHTVRT